MEFRGYTIKEVVRLLEDSRDSEIDEDPEFLQPNFLSSDEEHQQEDTDILLISSNTTSQSNNNYGVIYSKNKWHFIHYSHK